MTTELTNIAFELTEIGELLNSLAYSQMTDEGILSTEETLFLASNYINRLARDIDGIAVSIEREECEEAEEVEDNFFM